MKKKIAKIKKFEKFKVHYFVQNQLKLNAFYNLPNDVYEIFKLSVAFLEFFDFFGFGSKLKN